MALAPALFVAFDLLQLTPRLGFLSIRSDLDNEVTVAASEMGAIGYYCDCRILDTLGLVSREALRYYSDPAEAIVAKYAIPARLMQDLAPEYVVNPEVFMRRTLPDPR